MIVLKGPVDYSAFCQLEPGLLAEFIASLEEAHEEMHECFQRLKTEPSNIDVVNRCFRSMHSAKGNCRMVFLDAVAPLYHELEEMLDKVRHQTAAFSAEMGEFQDEVLAIILGIVRRVRETGRTPEEEYIRVVDAINLSVQALDASTGVTFGQALQRLYGHAEPEEDVAGPGELPPDIILLREFGGLLDNLTAFRKGRSQETVKLSRLINEFIGKPVDALQLEAASYMHDFGMAFVPLQILQKEEGLGRDEIQMVKHHVFMGARLLKRFGGWEDASLMVLQHHERIDGSGYPHRLHGGQISIGAKILAVADTFCAVTNERSDRTHRKTLFGAVKEINSNAGTLYEMEIVEALNEVVRAVYLRQSQ